jgi:fatty acid desaturase
LLAMTRHVECNLFERLLIAPNYIHVHIGHHLYPSVPFYNLRKLQQLLMQNPDYARRAHVTHGYIGCLRELIGSGARPFEPVYSRCRGNDR